MTATFAPFAKLVRGVRGPVIHVYPAHVKDALIPSLIFLIARDQDGKVWYASRGPPFLDLLLDFGDLLGEFRERGETFPVRISCEAASCGTVSGDDQLKTSGLTLRPSRLS